MALFTTLAALSQTPGSNAPDGSTDAPSTIDDQMRSLASFIAIERDGGHQWATAVGGTNTIAITVNGISSLVAGQTFKFVAAGANTGAVTLNVNSLGAKSVFKHGASALAAGDIANLSTVVVTYDGTNFQLAGVAQSASLSASGWAKFSNGLIVQWGQYITTASTSQSITLPIAFPTAKFAHFAPRANGASFPAVIIEPTFVFTDLGTIPLILTSAQAGIGLTFFAIGN